MYSRKNCKWEVRCNYSAFSNKSCFWNILLSLWKILPSNTLFPQVQKGKNTGSPWKWKEKILSQKYRIFLDSWHVSIPGCVLHKPGSWKDSRGSLPTNRTKTLSETEHVSKGVNIFHPSFLMSFFYLSLSPLFQESWGKFLVELFACLSILDLVLYSKWQEQPALIWTGLIKTYFLPAFGLERYYFPLVDGLFAKWPTADGLITSTSLEESCTCWKSHPKGICSHASFTATLARDQQFPQDSEVSG